MPEADCWRAAVDERLFLGLDRNSSGRQSPDHHAIISTCSSFIAPTTLDTPQGEEALLFIRTGYVTKKIGQTSALPGALNNLIITLEVNKALPGSPDGTGGEQAEIRFSGLRGGVPAAPHVFDLDTGARFIDGGLILRGEDMYFKLQEPSIALQQSIAWLKSFALPILQINIRNDVLAQEPPEIFIQIDLYSGSMIEENLFRLAPVVVPGKPSTPLYIEKVWTRADGGQTQASPASINLITITLQTNFPIFRDDTLTISGLLGAVARKGPIALLKRNSSSPDIMEPSTVFSSDLCPDQVGSSGEGYWCPGSSKECPCVGDTARRMILKYAQDVDPCPGTGSIQQCMAHKESQVIFSFTVYNPYIDNGQAPPIITLKLDNNSNPASKYVLPDTIIKTCQKCYKDPGDPDPLPDFIIKTCQKPATELLDANEKPIRWFTDGEESTIDGDCVFDSSYDTQEGYVETCVRLASDRTTVGLQNVVQNALCLPLVRVR